MYGLLHLRTYVRFIQCDARAKCVCMLRNVVRSNILINPSGIKGHAMGVDYNQELAVGYQKVRAYPYTSIMPI